MNEHEHGKKDGLNLHVSSPVSCRCMYRVLYILYSVITWLYASRTRVAGAKHAEAVSAARNSVYLVIVPFFFFPFFSSTSARLGAMGSFGCTPCTVPHMPKNKKEKRLSSWVCLHQLKTWV